ncbi:MAG: hypothetical protein U5K43_10120 [Halofilum sp. (in: g-proteobacteria)]|nr:hypothetical protein [Halofilum sp. (in: g-proteobacteria)]
MDRGDLALYRQLAARGEELVGYPHGQRLRGVHLRAGEKPLHGDLTRLRLRPPRPPRRGRASRDLFARLDLPSRGRSRTATRRSSATTCARWPRWDKAENHGRVFGAVAGVRTTRSSAPSRSAGRTRWWGYGQPAVPAPARAVPGAQRIPAARGGAAAAAGGGGSSGPRPPGRTCSGWVRSWSPTTATCPNLGPGSFPRAAAQRPGCADLAVDGCALDAPGEAHREVGHLRGWGRGLGQGADSPMFMRSAGNDSRRTSTWLVRGGGTATLRAGNARVVVMEETVTVGA